MGQKVDYDNAYAKGREDAAKKDHGALDAGKVLGALVTGGASVGITGITVDHYDPPVDEATKAAYDRGWKDERGELA